MNMNMQKKRKNRNHRGICEASKNNILLENEVNK